MVCVYVCLDNNKQDLTQKVYEYIGGKDSKVLCRKTAVFTVYPPNPIGDNGGVDFFGGFKIGGFVRRPPLTYLALYSLPPNDYIL